MVIDSPENKQIYMKNQKARDRQDNSHLLWGTLDATMKQLNVELSAK